MENKITGRAVSADVKGASTAPANLDKSGSNGRRYEKLFKKPYHTPHRSNPANMCARAAFIHTPLEKSIDNDMVCFCFIPGVSWGIPQPQSDWSLSCDHRLDYAS